MSKLFFAIFLTFFLVAVVALLVMFLWNYLIPTIFIGGPTIGYWQAVGLMILVGLLNYNPSNNKSN